MSDRSKPPAGRILIVEDDRHTRRINREVLEHAGYLVEMAEDGAEAIVCVRRHRPDLVVMDLALPGIGGLEATRRIKEEGGRDAPPVVMLTARALRDDVEAARRAGCDAYLAKPCDPFDLLDVVGRLLVGQGDARS